jgi:hypothetical protein
MKLYSHELDDLTVLVANEKFGQATFKRRRLMLAVESRLREIGAWTSDDDTDSQSAGQKSAGLARIDWSITRLKDSCRLFNIGRDQWRLP